MHISRAAVKRPVATSTILILILVIGLVSLYQSPLDLLPDIQFPVLAVITVFPGSSPQETLELVSKPIEDTLAATSGLTGMSSFSQESLSLVILSFDWGTDVKRIREDVNVRMDLMTFPDGVQRPLILEFDPTLMPIMQVSASGTEDAVALTEWLNETASPRLEAVRGVASVQVQGGARQDLFVRTTPESMQEYQVSFEQIAGVLRASLTDLPAGIIDLEDRQVRIRFLGRYAESEMLSELIVGFQIDEEALERLIGQEIDINLNQIISGQGGFTGGSGVELPVRELYWDDIFDFDAATTSAEHLYIPLQQQWLEDNFEDVERSLLLFTINPSISYEPENSRLAFSLSAIGWVPVGSPESLGEVADSGLNRLEDIWLINQAVPDNGSVIIPLDPLSIERRNISEEDILQLEEIHPLITAARPGYVIVSFHQDWDNVRRDPIFSVPDYGAWLQNVQAEVDRGLVDASRFLEDGLTDLATAMIAGSMSPGGGGGFAFGDFDFDDDFPITPITLGMVAEITQDTYNPTMISRYNRQPSIGLAIQKEGDANTVLVARQVRDALDKLSEESRGGFSQITFNTVFDQAEEIERALADLAWSLLGGAALAIMVLIVFLRNWRTTMFIGISIPAAIIATFSLLYFTNLTINLMTLGGLALAAGMLVDNAIVVSENIFRHYQMGKSPADASIDGSREVSGAITASTLTTISVFFPVVFLTGLAGQLFWEFALTVACAILASLLVALTVIPLLASRSLKNGAGGHPGDSRPRLLSGYHRLLKPAVSHPWWVLIFALLLVAIGAFGFTTLGTELFPSPDEAAFTVNVTLPPGTTLANTDAYVMQVEEILERRPEIESFTARVGGSGFMAMPAQGGNSNQARLRAQIAPGHVGNIDQIIEEVRQDVTAISAEADASFARESLLDAAGLETRLDLVVAGPDLQQVMAITGDAVNLLAGYDNFTDVQSSLEESRPEIHIKLDHGEALQKGVTLAQVATAVRQALEGIPVSRIETSVGVLDIVLGYQKSDINTIEDLGRIGFYTPNGEYLQLNEVADLSEAFGPQSIPRENQQVVGQIQVQYSSLDLGSATSEALSILEALELPDGYEIRTAGSSDLMADVLSELQLVLLLAALLVYLVMAAQFESLLHPFIIICSLPLAYIGAIAGLIITGNSISIPAMIGVVVLSGILVNDGIIMVDFINQQRRLHGMNLQDAIIEGATARLRPILMTTATTVLGLLPLALGIGEGAQLQAPMAITIIGGQITGTLLLLFAIPSIYKVVTREQPGGEAALQAEAAGAEVVSGRAAQSVYKEKALHTGDIFGPSTRSVSLLPSGRKGRRNGRNGRNGKNASRSVARMIIVLVLAGLMLALFSYFAGGCLLNI